MESFDMFLNGNFVALGAFKERYGVQVAGEVGKTIPTKWQSSLFQAGQCGAFVGVFLAGPITNRLGYRWTTLLALMLMNATIFISFFADSLAVLVIGQAFEGIPWGMFIANSPAYASEVVPLVLRGACRPGSSSPPPPTATTSATTSGHGEVLWRYSGFSPLLSWFSSSSPPSHPGGLCAEGAETRR